MLALLATVEVQQSPTTYLVFAGITAVGLIISASIPTWLIGRNARMMAGLQAEAEKRAEDRQDEVAARVEEAARIQKDRTDEVAKQAEHAAELLVANQQELKGKTEEVAVAAADAAKTLIAIDSQVKEVHALSNSAFTSAMEASLDSSEGQFVALLEIHDLKEKAGIDPSPEAIALMETTRQKIVKLKEVLAERYRQQKVVENMAATSAAIAAGPTEVVVVNPNPVEVTISEKEKAAAAEAAADVVAERQAEQE